MNPTWRESTGGYNNQEQSPEITRTTHQVTVSVNERTPLILNGAMETEHAHIDADFNSALVHVLFMIGLSLFLIIGVGAAGYLLITEGSDWITWSTYSVVRRADWNAEKSVDKLISYDTEITRVVLISTKTNSCWGERQCCAIVKKLQKYQIHTSKEPDIMYNFLIGNDDQVYEGTGWKTKLENYNKNRNNTIIIALIGDSKSPILNSQQEATKTFLDVSVNRKLINKCFTILVPFDYRVSDYFLINFASELQKYADKYCSEKLLFF